MDDNIVTLEIDGNAMKDASRTDQPLKCPKCTRTFNNVGHLKCHFYRVHSEFRLAACTINSPPPPSENCTDCKKSFSTKKELEEHECKSDDLVSGSGLKCEKCHRIFSRKSSLFRHTLRVHEKTHVCDVCEKEFVSKSYLAEHYRTHTKEELFACEICNAAFTSEKSLKLHFNSHDRKFKCKVCKKLFAHKGFLARHSLTHKKK